MKKKTKQKTVLGLLSAVVLSLAIGFSTGETSVQAATNLTMGKVNWLTSDQFNFSDLDIGTTESIKTVIVSLNKKSLIESSIDRTGKTMNTNIDRTMYTFTYTNKAKPETVETFLRNLKFSYLNGQTINIVLDANETNIPNNAAMTNGTGKLAGHYYMYVPDNTKIPWTTAYNNAKSFSYLGMKGYLATITSQEEDKLLQNISMAGAWSGGTRILSNGDSGNLLSDPTNVALTYRVKDMSDLQGYTLAQRRDAFYWACGPEATSKMVYQNWYEGSDTIEPNSGNIQGDIEAYMQVNYSSNGQYKWNDLSNSQPAGAFVSGYFVEFGGYGDRDPGFVNGNTGKPLATGSAVIQSNTVKVLSVYNNSSFSASTNPNSVITGQPLNLQVITKAGWTLEKNDIEVIIGGTPLPAEGYSIDDKGNISIPAEKINGNVVVHLSPKLDWYTGNNVDLNKYLKATSVTKDDLTRLKELKNDWVNFGINSDEKKYVSSKTGVTVDEIDKKLDAMVEASTFANDKAAGIELINSITSVNPNTDETIRMTISNVREAYEALSPRAKTYLPNLNKKLTDLEKAQEYCDKYKDVYNSTYANKDMLSMLRDFETDYNKLTPDQQSLVADTYAKLKKMNKAAEMLNQHDGIIASKPAFTFDCDVDNVGSSIDNAIRDLGTVTFIDPAITTDLNNKLLAKDWALINIEIINKKTPMTISDLDVIQNALTSYNQLNDKVKEQIDTKIYSDLNDKLAAAKWNETHKDIIANKGPMKATDVPAIEAALNAYKKLDESEQKYVDQNIVTELQNKLAAAKWNETHKDIIANKGPMKATDLGAVNKALSDYEKLKNAEKAYVDNTIVVNLKDKQVASQFLTDNPVLAKDAKELSYKDLDDLTKASSDYVNLTENQKALVDEPTKLIIKATDDANKWLKDNHDIIAKKTVDKDDMTAIDKALKSYEALSEDAKRLIDPSIVSNLNAKKKAANWAKDHDGIISKDPKDITAKDLDDLRNAMNTYNQLTDAEKGVIDKNVVNKLIDAQKNAFIEKYVSDKDGNVYKESNSSNYEQILSGEDTWNDMSKVEKDAINKALITDGSKTYEELIASAKALEETTNKFIKDYVSDDKGNIYKDADSSNYKQILSGVETWDKMTQDQKDAVNAKLTANGGKTYEELIASAKELEETTNKFIKDYVSDDKGNIYKDADSSNYKQILSGVETWGKMTQDQKDAVNAKLTSNGGKTYEELIASAKALEETANKFIKDYVSDKNGKIYKVATKDNYAQILSGKTEWDKMTQDQKDAINAILLANGGKTYEDLLKQAEEIKKSVKTGDDNEILPLGILMASSLLLGGYEILRKKKRV